MEKGKKELTDISIETLIYEIRGQKVMLDKDLAKLYGVETKVLNQAVKRNINRFPEDFMFQLTHEECLRSQIVTLNTRQGHHLKYMPYAFTEQGVAMLSSVLKSDSAIEINIRIIRTFVFIRKSIYTSQILNAELEVIKSKLELLERNDEENLAAINDVSEDVRKEIDTIYQAIAALAVNTSSDSTSRKKIGFKSQNSK
jgi:hypothetical protein